MDEQSMDQSESSIFDRLICRQSVESACSHQGLFEGVASETDLDGFMSSGDYVGDRKAILSLQPWVFRTRGHRNNGEKMKVECRSFHRSGCELNGPVRSRSSLRSRRPHRFSVRPLSSSRNSLIPQLYDEHFAIEDYVFSSPLAQTAQVMRPFVVTDGEKTINSPGYNSLGQQFKKGSHKGVNAFGLGAKGSPVGVFSLPELKKPKRRGSEEQHKRSDTSASSRSHKLLYPQGSPGRLLLFSLGISFGMVSTILSSKREVEKLDNLLKDTKNLVEDLQEELEMKESLTVKELVAEAYENQDTHENNANTEQSFDTFQNRLPESYCLSHETSQHAELHLPKAVENSDSMRKIEAELEAELERLELNMNTTSLEGRRSALDEVDADLIEDAVHGELRADMFNSETREGRIDFNQETTSTSEVHTYDPNYSVSPRQLSLRLHEVIQERLEERIKELERDLQHSQKQLRFIKTKQTLSNSDIESSSDQESSLERVSDLARPFCLNLSEDALVAYDEAYEELMRMTDLEETRPSTTDTSGQLHTNESQCDQSMIGDDEYEIDDEEGKMIQEIVARSKKGSPVFMYVQRMLFSGDDE